MPQRLLYQRKPLGDHVAMPQTTVLVFQKHDVAVGNAEALRELAEAGRVPWRQVQRGDALSIGGVDLTILNPPLPDWERPRVRNDDSVVIRVRFGAVELLLTGDISDAVEREVPLADERARIRVLKVAHHGSRTSSSSAFLTAYAPQIAVASAGRSNPFGHPSPDVLERLAWFGRRAPPF